MFNGNLVDLVNNRDNDQGFSTQNDPNQQVEQTREETIYNTTHGSDRGSWRDEDMKFTNRNEPEARLHFTPTQIDEARKEMEEDLENRAEQIPTETSETVTKDPLDLIPQEPLVDYTKVVDIKEPLIKEAGGDTNTRRMIYPFGDEQIKFGFNEFKDALENRKLKLSNGDVYLTYLSGRKDEQGNPISKTPIILSNEQFDSIQKAIVHQDELDKNTEMNKDFRPLQSFSQNRQDFFNAQEKVEINSTKKEISEKDFLNAIPLKPLRNFTQISDYKEPVVTNVQDGDNERLMILLFGSDYPTFRFGYNELKDAIENRKIELPNGEVYLTYLSGEKDSEGNPINKRPLIITTEQFKNIQEAIKKQEEVPIVQNDKQLDIQEDVSPKVQQNSTTAVIPDSVTVQSNRIAQLEDQLREFKGENSPEQKSLTLAKELADLEEKMLNGGLTDAEKIIYFDLQFQKNEIDKQLNILQIESEKKRINKEKWIKIAAGVAGFGVALATPAVGVAAVIGVTLGGRVVGKALQSLGTKLRSKSNAIKYKSREGKNLFELTEMDKRQKRNQWWANRLGEAGAVLIGGATGYGLGTLFEGIVGKDFYIGMNNQPTPEVPTMPESNSDTPNEAPRVDGHIQQPEAPVTPQSEAPGIIEQPIVENWLPGDTFNASDFGWNYNEMGWLGNKVYLTNAGGNSGILQGDFFKELARLVPKDQLLGQESGNIVNQFLRAAYGGMNPSEAASKAAELLLAN